LKNSPRTAAVRGVPLFSLKGGKGVKVPGVFAAVCIVLHQRYHRWIQTAGERAMIDESKIRERAYALWEKDACPDGADCFYWYLAQDQLKTSLQLSRGQRAHGANVKKGSVDNRTAETLDEN
jgi:hypothetical protein